MIDWAETWDVQVRLASDRPGWWWEVHLTKHGVTRQYQHGDHASSQSEALFAAAVWVRGRTTART